MAKRRRAGGKSAADHGDSLDEVLQHTDIRDVAQELGFELTGRGTGTAKTLCPFHPDKRPSLHLFGRSPGESRDHFHCFACGAHGDAIALVKEVKGCDFRTAANWLADRIHARIVFAPTRPASQKDRDFGFATAEHIYSKPTLTERELLERWIDTRRLPKGIIDGAELSATLGSKLFDSVAGDRESIDGLLEAGLLVRLTRSRSTQPPTLFPEYYRDFFHSKRILFPLRTDDGDLVGYAGRAVEREEPKYLYTRGFSRSTVLYRIDAVRKRVLAAARRGRKKGERALVHLFLVEGLVDALRLESLGLDAVAVLGSSITDGQVQVLSRLAADVERTGRLLVVHLFLDADEAGRRGTVQALRRLLPAALKQFFLIDVIAPRNSSNEPTGPRDPDELLADTTDAAAARQLVIDWAHPVISALLAAEWNSELAKLGENWAQRTYAQEVLAFRGIEQLLSGGTWDKIWSRLRPAHVWFEEHEAEAVSPWCNEFERFLGLQQTPAESTPEKVAAVLEPSVNEQLQRAVLLAHASTQRRELPVDDGSWQRLQLAINAFVPYFKDLLATAAKPVEPFVATVVPKSDGTFRFKALPAPEELVLQQYILVELLRDYRQTRLFMERMPAVRYSRRSRDSVTTTGPDELRPKETVSFAYQVDMDVVEGLVPARREGIFRPYYQCWQDFIRFLDVRSAALHAEYLYVARLDVRRYYDALERTIVNDVLFPSIKEALEALRHADKSGTSACASAFAPEATTPEDRAQKLVDWLCDQSFAFSYLKVTDGLIDHSKALRGIPQGPDLSAYLGSVALFPLDRAASNVVGEAAVYARYVDDIVIVATSAHGLRELRSVIEHELARLGLELNEKSQHYDPMSKEEFRYWLTDRRGGLGLSGIFAGPPLTQPILMDDPWIDAEIPMRDEALRVLYDPEYLWAETAKVIEAVRLARRADELRHNDLIRAAMLVWRSAATEAATGDRVNLAARFVELWLRTDASRDRSAEGKQQPSAGDLNEQASTLFAWLDGLAALLLARPEYHQQLRKEDQDIVIDAQKAAATFACGGRVADFLVEQAPSLLDAASMYRHVVLLKSLQNVATASQRGTAERDLTHASLGVSDDDMRSPAVSRLLITIAQQTKSPGLMGTASGHTTRGTLDRSRLLFHEAICRLRIMHEKDASAAFDGSRRDALEPISGRLISPRQRRDGAAADSLLQILRCWLPGGELDWTTVDAKTAHAALESFLNVAKNNVRELMTARPHFAAKLLSDGDERIRLIPGLPGMDTPGLLGVKDEHIVRRRDLKDRAVSCPETLEWNDVHKTVSTQGLCEAELAPKRLLVPLAFPGIAGASYPPKSKVDQLRWLAEAFANLASADTNVDRSPPSPFNLLAGRDLIPDEVLGYRMVMPVRDGVEDERAIRHSAFRFQGINSLERVDVPHFYAQLWQVGTALAEMLGYGHESYSIPEATVTRAGWNNALDLEALADKLLRIAFSRLRGRWDPTSFVAQDRNGWPKTVARVIAGLKRFPTKPTQTSSREAAAVFLAIFVEGRALRLRYGDDARVMNDGAPGRATAFLARLAQEVVGFDLELCQLLPKARVYEPGLRRSVMAWLRVAKRLEGSLSSHLPDSDSERSGVALMAGCRILALASYFRALTLELWSTRAPEDIRDTLRGDWTDATSWIDHAWVLEASQADASQDEQSGEAQFALQSGSSKVGRATAAESWPVNLRLLFDRLQLATSVPSARYWNDLNRITPLGWLIALSFTLKAWRKTWFAEIQDGEDAIALDSLQECAQWLAVRPVPLDDRTNDAPWSELRSAVDVCNHTHVASIIETLQKIERKIGIRIESCDSPHLRIGGGRAQRLEVRVDDGTRDLPAWQISVASAARDTGVGAEHHLKDGRRLFRWSESRYRGALLGIHIAQPNLALWAGFEPDDTSLETSAESRRLLATGNVAEEIPAGIEAANAPDETSPERDPIEDRRPSTSVSSSGGHTGVARLLGDLRRIQSAAWQARSAKPESHLRIALVQWRVDDSYRHPIVDSCVAAHPELGEVLNTPTHWSPERASKHAFCVQSCNEHRRRRILKEVLRACRDFEVDVLLLPEYSVRPETIGWLSQQLAEVAPQTSVWAGTFRRPPYSEFRTPDSALLADSLAIKGAPPWSANFILIDPRPGKKRFTHRCKKYPAIGTREVFAPLIGALKPLYNSGEGEHDLRAKLTELICSEIFLVTSPANLAAAAWAYSELLVRFGQMPPAEAAQFEADANKRAKDDLESFGNDTSIIANPFKRRSIILVPAMTSRTADYAILGQAGFLASGLTTVFCNAVDPPFGSGRSCFIGHDGWGNDARSLPALPGEGPYHGAVPGIFRPTEAIERGCLGKDEQAVVIADVDTQFAMEGRPRPQLLPLPLQLVAHLPILETWKRKEFIDFGTPTSRCHCLRSREWEWCEVDTHVLGESQGSLASHRNDIQEILQSARSGGPRNWLEYLLNVLRHPVAATARPPASSLTTIDHPNRAMLAEAIVLLAIAFRDSRWMWPRAEQFLREHAANPQPWPPPAALDWLVVELGKQNDEKWPMIEVPPYAGLANDHRE